MKHVHPFSWDCRAQSLDLSVPHDYEAWKISIPRANRDDEGASSWYMTQKTKQY
jgi:hypothetical protein